MESLDIGPQPVKDTLWHFYTKKPVGRPLGGKFMTQALLILKGPPVPSDRSNAQF